MTNTQATITDGLELISPHVYAEHGPPHELFRQLRAESPVHRCEPPGFEPFWAITRQEDIRAISRQPDKFLSEPGITLLPRDLSLIDRSDGIGANSRPTLLVQTLPIDE